VVIRPRTSYTALTTFRLSLVWSLRTIVSASPVAKSAVRSPTNTNLARPNDASSCPANVKLSPGALAAVILKVWAAITACPNCVGLATGNAFDTVIVVPVAAS